MGPLGYATPAIAYGRVFVGSYDGTMRAFRATDGALMWRHFLGGRIHAPALIVGNLVLFSTLDGKTYALRASDGQQVWRFNAGEYAVGIATNRNYYLSLNGLLLAIRGENSPKE
jgi:outer membrane protein assembly factor BamB